MPLRYRHTGVGLAMSAQWLMAFLTVYAGPIAFAMVGWKVWIWFAVFNVVGFPYVYYFLRETSERWGECCALEGLGNVVCVSLAEKVA
jgi:hypothetical protein